MRIAAALVALFVATLAHAGPQDIIVKFESEGAAYSARIASGATLRRSLRQTGAEVKAAILDNVDPIPALSGLCVTGGRLNIYAAMSEEAPCSEPPCEEYAARQPRDETVRVHEAVGRTDLYDVTGRKVRATTPGIYFHRPAVGPRRTVVVVP